MWIKKHWNDPITVGGYTKLCVWSFVISFIIAVAEIAYFGFKWFRWGDKIRELCSAIGQMFKKSKEFE